MAPKSAVRIDVLVDDLSHGPNLRQKYAGIPELADSIVALGLLQNLVVAKVEEGYEVRAGQRRLRAIRFLVDQGRWPKSKKVPCLLVEGASEEEQLAENEPRDQLHPWEAGKGYVALVTKGYTHEEIGMMVGKSRQHVSLCAKIYEGLAPKVVEVLSRLGPGSSPNILVLSKMSEILDVDTGKPDEKAQMEALSKHLTRKPGWKPNLPGPFSRTKVLRQRYDAMLAMDDFGEHAPVVRAVLKFLSGEGSELELPPCRPAPIPPPALRGISHTRSTASTRRRRRSG
jgi:ParB/RepB/Spo0J family partition protein